MNIVEKTSTSVSPPETTMMLWHGASDALDVDDDPEVPLRSNFVPDPCEVAFV